MQKNFLDTSRYRFKKVKRVRYNFFRYYIYLCGITGISQPRQRISILIKLTYWIISFIRQGRPRNWCGVCHVFFGKSYILLLFFFWLEYYLIGLEKVSDKWEWTGDRSVVFNTSLWHPSEPNGHHFLLPELCGAVGHFLTGGIGIFDISCTYYKYICEI